MQTLYLVHSTCACLSIAGFFLRGTWMLTENPRLQTTLAKRLPHLVDTVLLLSAVAMLWQWRLSPLEAPWLMAKIIALLVYIGLGMVALRFGRTRRQKGLAWILALLTAVYIVAVALTKSPLGPLQ